MQLRRAGGLVAAVALLLGTSTASASNALESPDVGVQATGRGGAWFVRADDPLAAYFNPAAMAFQASGVHVGAALMFEKRCFTRQSEGGAAVSPGTGILGPGGVPAAGDKSVPPPAATCGTKPGLFPNPQLAGVFRISDRLAIGLAVVGPHADGNNVWPESIPYTNRFGASMDKAGNQLTQPAPNRYMLVSSDALLLFPTLSVAYAPMDNLSFGLGFTWGIATAEFTNFAEAIRTDDKKTVDNFTNDIRATLKAKDLFVPGIVASALWMPSKNLDLSAWFKWQDAFKTETADTTFDANYWTAQGLKQTDTTKVNTTQADDKASLKLNLPMEAKLGLRYHQARENANRPSWATKNPTRRVRDPLSEELFDIELDFTWANNSSIDQLYLQFQPGVKVDLGGGISAEVPTNANIPHYFKDVIGVRLGGDVNILPNRLAVRGGGFFETKGQSDAFLGLDFDAAQKYGLGLGATVRVGPLDFSASFQHTFFGTLDNKGEGGVHALSGDKNSCAVLINDGKTCNRSTQAINGGQLAQSLNEIGLGATMRF